MFDKNVGFVPSNCKSGFDFENQIVEILTFCHLDARRITGGDNGVDIIATLKHNQNEYKFYIQCKFHNRVLGKAPVHEVYAGHHFYGGDGYPVVITNNRMTAQAKAYAKHLGVEVIGEIEFNTMKLSYKYKRVENTSYTGLTGIIMGAICNDANYYKKSIENLDIKPEKNEISSKEQLKQELINNFEQAELLIQESAELQLQASNLQQQALNLQKVSLLKNLDYG